VQFLSESGIALWNNQLSLSSLLKNDVIPFFFIGVTTNAGLASIRAWMSVMDLEIWY